MLQELFGIMMIASGEAVAQEQRDNVGTRHKRIRRGGPGQKLHPYAKAQEGLADPRGLAERIAQQYTWRNAGREIIAAQPCVCVCVCE